MENIILRYSEFFQDDGGFDKVVSDFDRLGQDLVKKAEFYRSQIKLVDLDDLESMQDVEKGVEKLDEAFQKYGKAKEEVTEIEKEYRKQLSKVSESQEDQIEELVRLRKESEEYRDQLKKLDNRAKKGIQLTKNGNVLREDLRLKLKDINAETNRLQKEILETNKLSVKEQKLIKAKILLDTQQVKTLTDVRERMAALRLVVQSLDFKEQGEQIQEFNKEIDELTGILGDNSDKFIQNKINIGNYEESIANALKGSSLFTTQIGILDNAINGLVGALFITKDELEKLEDGLKKNTSALKRFTVAFGRLNKVMKASIIGVIIIAVAALGSAFGDTRAGTIRMEKAMLAFNSALTTFGQIAQTIFKGALSSASAFFQGISQFLSANEGKSLGALLRDFLIGDTGFTDAIGEILKGQTEAFKETFEELSKITQSGAEAVVKGLANIERAFQLEDQIKRLRIQVERLNGELSTYQSIADDTTKSFSTQLIANRRALELGVEIGEKQLEISRKELEAINERVKQNILANGVEADRIDLSQGGVAFAEATLDLAQQRGAALEVSNKLIEEQQNAVLEVIRAEDDLNSTISDNAKRRREINQGLFEQNLELLNILIESEKNLSKEIINNTSRNFRSRIEELNRFIVRFRQNAEAQIREFNKEAENLDLDVDFDVKFDEDGNLKVFVDGTELALDNIVELNKQLQDTGLNESDIDNFKTFVNDTKNGVIELRSLNKELTLTGIRLKEIVEIAGSNDSDVSGIESLQQRIESLIESSSGATGKRREELLKAIEELEDERTKLAEDGVLRRQRIRLKAIDEELKLVEDGSQREAELLLERGEIEKSIRENTLQQSLDALKFATDKTLDDYKKFADELRQILGAILDRVVNNQQKQVQATEDRVDRQNELTDEQRRRAEQGLTNTLAFEQRELGKREAERIKEQKRLERLEKIRALYSSYNNYASRGDDNPLVKALRDFAILEAITASFGDGGVVEDKLPTNGIFRGRSHQGRNGGIPIKVEGKEGILSAREMENLGKGNFYRMKELAGLGKVDSDFFKGQGQEFARVVPFAASNQVVTNELREIKQAIKNQPIPSWEIVKQADGTFEYVESIVQGNKTTTNRYRAKRRRLN